MLSSRRTRSRDTKAHLDQHARSVAVRQFVTALREHPIYSQLLEVICSLRLPENEIEEGKPDSLSAEEAHDMLEALCRVCWDQFEQTLESDSSGPLMALRQEVQKLLQRLDDCNLAAHKQIAALQENAEEVIESIDFYEPFQFLSPTGRELVLRIVTDKLRQIEDGSAPAWFMKAVLRTVHLDNSAEEEAAALAEVEMKRQQEEMAREYQLKREQEMEEQAEMHRRQSALSKTSRRTAAGAKDDTGDADPEHFKEIQELKSAKMEQEKELEARVEQVRLLEQQALDTKQRSHEIEQASQKMAARCRELMAENAKLLQQLTQSQHVAVREPSGPSKEELSALIEARAEARAFELAEQLANAKAKQSARDVAKQAANQAARHVQVGTQTDEVKAESLAETKTRNKGGKVSVETEELQQREFAYPLSEKGKSQAKAKPRPGRKTELNIEATVEKAEAKVASPPRAEASVQSQVDVHSVLVQTELNAKKLDASNEEATQLKVVVDELRGKMAELVEELHKEGLGGKVGAIVQKMGLTKLLDSQGGVYERLYADAKNRITKMQQLREQYKVELEKMAMLGIPMPEFMDSDFLGSVAGDDLVTQGPFWQFQGPFSRDFQGSEFSGFQGPPEKFSQGFKQKHQEKRVQAADSPMRGDMLQLDVIRLGHDQEEQTSDSPDYADYFPGAPLETKSLPVRSWRSPKAESKIRPAKSSEVLMDNVPDLTLYSQTSTSSRAFGAAAERAPRVQSKSTSKSPSKRSMQRQMAQTQSLPALDTTLGGSVKNFQVFGTSSGWR
eukprot:TRINITY_DN77920_c0_g1_i1.p1 TRINITY_DN77920_c0_g1~~TRINITY_DN77920_c0_g1_i1.p1  ORF type:complete len:788 (+),score=161.24 TRINITY_DN77920_c0_g1_i1:104-2467(+)